MREDGRPAGREMVPSGVVAIIPARGGSKGLPGKNVAPVGGVPLVARAIRAAAEVAAIDAVFVSTDNPGIARAARAAGAGVIERPAELAGDTASSESALLHALDAIAERAEAAPGVAVFLQATSPFIGPDELAEAVRRVQEGEADVVFSATPSHVFLWRETDAGAVGVNHDAATRPRRQDREPEFRETGAFYVLRTAGFLEARHRFFGRVGIQPVPEAHAVEIDTADDLALAEALAATSGVGAQAEPGEADAAPRAAPEHPSLPFIDVDAVVTDFDGVHTDDTALVDAEGREWVRVSRSDGHGVARLREAGYPVLILSAETNPVVGARAAKLGVEVLQGVQEKGGALAEWADARGIRLDRIAYLGNDLGDLPALALVGWPVAVADAVPEVREAARLVLHRRGGDGAVRELSDLIVGATTATTAMPTTTTTGATGAANEAPHHEE